MLQRVLDHQYNWLLMLKIISQMSRPSRIIIVFLFLYHVTFLLSGCPLKCVENSVFHAWTKHIECTTTSSGNGSPDIDLRHINTNLITIDIFMKVLGTDKLQQFSSGLSLSTYALPSLRGSDNWSDSWLGHDIVELEGACWESNST